MPLAAQLRLVCVLRYIAFSKSAYTAHLEQMGAVKNEFVPVGLEPLTS